MRGSPLDFASRINGRADDADKWTIWHRSSGKSFCSLTIRDIALVSRVGGRESKNVEYLVGSADWGGAVLLSSSA